MILTAEVVNLIKKHQSNKLVDLEDIAQELNSGGYSISITGKEDSNKIIDDLIAWSTSASKLIVGNSELVEFLKSSYGALVPTHQYIGIREPDPTLLGYGICLTDMASRGKLDITIGREVEVNLCIDILCRRTKSSPILVGQSGVGKSAIVNGIAHRMAAMDIPPKLIGKNIYSLSMSNIIQNTMMMGMIESKVEKLITILEQTGDIIFIDEIQEFLNKPIDILGMLLGKLGDGSISLVATTTDENYTRYIEPNPGLERRFQKVMVKESSIEDTRRILYGIRSRYESYHEVKVPDEVLDIIPKLAAEHLADRHNPDASIELLDSSLVDTVNSSIVSTNHKNWESMVLDGRFAEASVPITTTHNTIVTPDNVLQVLTRITGKEVILNDYDKIKKLEEELKSRIVNQDSAIGEVVKFLRVSHVYHNPDKPLGSMLFLGPPGVGKTYLAQIISDVLFNGNILKLDMSEYSEKFTVSRLIGSPPGYVGYDEGGILTQHVRRNPYCVVLFDEIEKAHPEVYNILLSIMDRGTLLDMRGREARFNNVLVLLTSNIGTRHITDAKEFSIGFEGSKIDTAKEITADVKKFFSPEFIDRLSGTVQFNKLTKDNIYRIIDLEIEKLHNGPKISINKDAKNILLEDWKEGSGARQVILLIARKILDEVSKMVVDGKLDSNGIVSVTAKDGKLKFKVK